MPLIWFSVAAESKKGFLNVTDKKDGYSFLYPFGWQVSIRVAPPLLLTMYIDPCEPLTFWFLISSGLSCLSMSCFQEVVIGGQDKVFKDVIEPLESVSVNMIPTGKQDIRDFGPPEQVLHILISVFCTIGIFISFYVIQSKKFRRVVK